MPPLTTAVGINRPRGFRELPSNCAISFEDWLAQPELRAFEAKASLCFRIVRLEASRTGAKLAREVKAAHMTYLQAVPYLAKGLVHKFQGLTLPLVNIRENAHSH